MRSFPSCWNKTLAQLGFKRKRRKIKQRDYMRRRSLFESLEPRQMLSITVDTLVDENDGNFSAGDFSLREAIAEAIAGETIDFSPTLFSGGLGTLALTQGELVINSDLTITGPGADLLSIDAQDNSRVFRVDSGDVTLNDLSITGGKDSYGGGISLIDASLALTNVEVSGNEATASGGGIFNFEGTLNISQSTVSGNTAAQDGGGVYSADGSLTISQSTFSGNEAALSGGGIHNDGSLLSILQSTIYENEAGVDGGGLNVNNSSATASMHNTIVAGNKVVATDDDISGDFAGGSYNLIGVITGSTGLSSGMGTIYGTAVAPLDAQLSPLGNYGGPTLTHGLLSDSPAIDKASNALAPLTTDQRGYDRNVDIDFDGPTGGTVDIGALEYRTAFVVSTLKDESDTDYSSGDLSLREALSLAAASVGPDTIEFDSSLFSSGSATLLLGDADGSGAIEAGETPAQLVIDSDVDIFGPGVDLLTIDGGLTTRVFYLNSGVTAEISGVSIEQGYTINGGGGIVAAGDLTLTQVTVAHNEAGNGGGGVFVEGSGSLKVYSSTFHDNDAGANKSGGGISGFFGEGETLIISDSTFYSNTAATGGAVKVQGNGGANGTTVTITNSTFSGNTTTSSGGAFNFQSFVGSNVDATLVNNTITLNEAQSSVAGGIYNVNPSRISITLHNTILADNTAGNTNYLEGWGNLNGTGSSYNLIGTTYNNIGITDGVAGNMVGTASVPIDPLLAPLANNNGPTETHAVLFGSPALDAGNDAYAPEYDQRMHLRPFDLTGIGNEGTNTTDIGSFEPGNPTTLTVRVLNDELDSEEFPQSFDLSLREAIDWANRNPGQEKIVFDLGLFDDGPKVINLTDLGGTLSSKELVVSGSIQLMGPGSDLLTIHGQADVLTQGSVLYLAGFDISSGDEIDISGLTLTGGHSSYGGGIESLWGDLTLEDVAVVGNLATFGGGISHAGDLTLNASQVTGNTAERDGGGIYSYQGQLAISNSSIANNIAGAISPGGSGYTGGGIYIRRSSVDISGSTISGNSAGTGGGINANHGAGGNQTFAISNSTISGNHANSSGGGIALDTYYALPVRSFTNVTITANTADSGAAGISGSWGSGDVNFNNTILAGNFVTGTPSVEDNIGSDPLVGSNNLLGSDVSITGTSNIILPIGADPGLTPLGDNGGPTQTHALLPTSPAIDAGGTAAASGLTTDQRGFQRNIDFDGLGGTDNVDIGAYELGLMVSTLIDEDDTDYTFGDLSLREALRLAAMQPEKDQILFDPALAGGTIVLDPGTLRLDIDSEVEIFGPGSSLLTIDANASAADPRRVFSVVNTTATIEGVTITGGHVVGTGAGGGISSFQSSLTLRDVVVRDNYAGDVGGGINAFGGPLYIVDSTVTNNTAVSSGGGVRFKSDDQLDIIGSTIADNVSGSDGGGVFAEFNSVQGSYQARVIDSEISDNEASGSGGGIRGFLGDSWLIENSTVSKNKAEVTGGGLANIGGSLIVSNSEISDNTARHTGGGFWLRGTTSSIYEITNSTIASNRLVGNSGAKGAGISVEAIGNNKPHISIQNSTISSNYSPGDAGGIYLRKNSSFSAVTATVVNSTITENTAVGVGGGFVGATPFDVVTLHNTILAGNEASSLADISGTMAPASSYNLFGAGGDPFAGSNNVFLASGEDSGLSQLGYYGGPTKTHTLLPGSKAIDAGDPVATGLTTDQRGFSRTLDGPDTDNQVTSETVDIGSTELPLLVATADFNNDSRDDFAFLDLASNSIYVTSDTTRAAGTNVWLQNGSAGDWTILEPGDFNGDGRDDLAVFDSMTNQWSLAISDSTQFSFVDLGLSTSWSEVYVGDFDGDGADELLGWNSMNWEVLDYDEKFGATLKNWGTAVYGAQGVTAAEIQIGDTNRDGRADLIAYNNVNNEWWVGLSQYNSGTGYDSFVEQDWDNWFDAYADPVTHIVANSDAPIQQIITEFESVYNTVELELYRGFMKGIEATAETKAGNSFDQAALLDDRLDQAGFDSNIVIGTIDVDWQIIRDWIGAPDSLLNQADKQGSVLALVQTAFDPSAISVGSNIRFNHAWVDVTAPTATDLSPISVDPSWKFKDLQPGILPADPDVGLDLNINVFLSDQSGRQALEYYEDVVIDFHRVDQFVNNPPIFVNSRPTGISIADIPYDGPILTRAFTDIPDAFSSSSGVNFFQQLDTFTDFGALVASSSARDQWTHRVEIDLRRVPSGTSGDGTSILTSTELVTVPESAFVPITITYSGDIPQLNIGNNSIAATTAVLPADLLKVRVNFYNPGENAATPNTRQHDFDTLDQRFIALGLNAGQSSETRLASLQESTLANVASPGVEDTEDILSLIATSYSTGVERSIAGTAAATNDALIRASVEVVAISGNTADFTLDSNAPYGFLLGGVEVDISIFGSPLHMWNTALQAIEDTRVLFNDYSSIEGHVLEDVFGAPSVSTIVGLKKAYLRLGGEDQNGTVFDDNEILEIRVTNAASNEFLLTIVFRSIDGETNFSVQGDLAFIQAELESKLVRHNDSQGNFLSQLIIAKVSAPDAFLDPDPSIVLEGVNLARTVFRVPKSFVRVGNWVGDVIQTEIFKNDGTDVEYGISIRELNGLPKQGGASGGIPVPPNLLVPSGNASFQPIDEGTVNLANGNLVRADLDTSFPNIGVALTFNRRYNSQSQFTLGASVIDMQSGFGRGWTHSFSDQLIHAGGDPANPDLLWVTSTGGRHLFTFNDTDYDTPAQLKGKFEKVNSTSYRYLERDGIETHFETATLNGIAIGDSFARLSQKLDLNGNGILVEYDDANSRPKNVTSVMDVHTSGRRLDFGYDFSLDATNGHISSITKFDGGIEIGTGGWTYAYQDLGAAGVVLTSVTSPTDSLLTTSAVVSYEYHPETSPAGFRGFLKRATETNGDYQQFSYYLNGRVFKSERSIDLKNVANANDDVTVSKTYAYNLVSNTTTVTDERGNAETFRHDQDGLLVRQIHADRSRVDSTWGIDDGSGTGTILPETRFLLTSRTDEVGGGETFDYFTSVDGFKEKELKSSIGKRYVRVDGSSIFVNSELVTEYDYVQATGMGRSHIVNLDTTRVDPTGENNLIDFDYDPQGRVISTVDPLLNQTTFEYFSTGDAKDGLLSRAISPRLHETTFEYDAAGNLTSTFVEGQQVASTSFDHNGNIESFTDGAGVVTEAIYDVLGRRTSAIAAGNGTTSNDLITNFSYDPRGQLLSTIDALGRETTFQYDARGNLVLVNNADGTQVSFEYDLTGNLIASTDELGRNSQLVVDERNQLIQTVRPDGSVQRIRYDGTGRIAAVIDALGIENRFDYDATGRSTRLIRALGTADQVITNNQYDLLGRLIQATDGEGHIVQNVYDALGRVTKTQILDEADELQPGTPVNTPKFVSTFDYDSDGNLIRSVVYDVSQLTSETATLLSDDPRSLILSQPAFVQEVEFNYNTLNQFVETVYVDAGVAPATDTRTQSLYDLAGRIRFQEDELGRIIETNYDAYGRVGQIILPDPDLANPLLDSPVTSITYDAVGNVLAVTDANQHTTTNSYDALNQLISSTNAENETTRFVYDLSGQLVGDIDALGRAVYLDYDDRGRVKLQVSADPDGNGLLEAPKSHFEYDAVGNLTSVIDAGGYATRFVYDSLNRVVAEQFVIEEFVDDTDIAGGNFSFVGNATYDGNRAGAFGDDVTIIEGDGVTAPSAAWVFSDLPESGTYRIATTWDADPTLDTDADLKYEFVSGFFNVSQASGGGFNQQQEPNDFFRDYGGDSLGWQIHPTQFTLSGGTGFASGPSDGEQVASDSSETGTLPITVTLTGSSPTSKIQADAVRIERFAQRTFTYDSNGNLESETDSLGRTTDFAYDEIGRLKTFTSADPDPTDTTLHRQVTAFQYDGYGNQTTIQDKRNGITIRTDTFSFDKRNRLTTEVLNVGGLNNDELTSEWIYDDVGNVLELREATTSVQDRVQTNFVYDNLNRLTEQRVTSVFGDPSQWSRKDTFAYDAASNLTLQTETIQDLSAVLQDSVETLFVYDGANRLIIETRDNGGALESTSNFAYDDVGNLLQETDATNRTSSFVYDALNRVIETILPDVDLSDGLPSKLVQRFTYNSLGDTVAQSNGEGETSQFIYDSLGRQTRSINPNGEQIVFAYDSRSNLLRQEDGENNVTSFQYDRLDRLVQETIVDQSLVVQQRTNSFNDRGNLLRTVDRNDRVREFSYDGLDRQTTEQWFNSVTDANSSNPISTLSWNYDQLSRITLSEQFDDVSGNRIYAETFDYDHLDRVTEQRNYDPNTTERLNPEVAQKYSYERLASLADPVSSTTGPGSFYESQYVLTFEPQGASANYANTDFVVDRLSRLGAIHDQAISARSIIDKSIEFSYDAADRLTNIDRSTSGTFWFGTDYAYDEAGRLETIDHRRGTPASSPFAAYDYQFDNASRITQIDATAAYTNLQLARTETYGFDSVGQLDAFSSNLTDLNPGYVLPGGGTRDLGLEDITHSFGYDDAGNRNSLDGTANTIEANNRVADDGQFDYVYDDEGNLTFRRTQGGGPETEYVWDQRNRLTEVIHRATQAGAVLERIEYVYNNDNLRVKKTVLTNGTLFESAEHYIYDSDQLAAVLDGTATPDVGTVQRRVVNGPVTDAPLFDEVYASGTVDQLFFAAVDHAGSVRDVIDGTNTNLVNHLEYDAFGEIALALNPNKEDVATDALAIDAAFAGREWDDDADLYYNRARWYNPELGRFISEDPIGFDDGPNVYRYAGNDPVNFRDPSGEFLLEAVIAFAIVVGVDFLDQEINGNDGGSIGINFGIGIGGGGVDVNVSADIGDVRISAGTGDPPQTDLFPDAEQVTLDEFEQRSSFGDLLFITGAEHFAAFEESQRIAFFGITDNRGIFGVPQRRGGISAFSRGAFDSGQGGAFVALANLAEGLTSIGIGTGEFGAALTVSGVGELQDIAVISDPTSPAWQKWISSISLTIAAVVGGVGPNAGTFFRFFRAADDGANVVGGAARSAPIVVSRISESPKLVRGAQSAGKSVQASIDNLTKQLSRGNISPGIGTKPIGRGISEARARDGARVFFRQARDGTIEILGKSNKANQSAVIEEVLKRFGN